MSRIDVVREVVKMDEQVEKLSRAVRVLAQYVSTHTDERDKDRAELFDAVMAEPRAEEAIRNVWKYQGIEARMKHVRQVEGALVRISEAFKNPDGPRCDTAEDWEVAEALRLRDLPPNTIIPGPAPAKPAPLRITEPPTTPAF